MTWTELISEYEVNPSFRSELDGALSSFSTGRQNFGLQQYQEELFTGYQSFRDFSFMPMSKWSERYPEASPSDMGMEVVEVRNERGEFVKGVLVNIDQPLTIRVMTTSGANLQELLQPSSLQLRAGQATSFRDWHQAEAVKAYPKCFTKPSLAKTSADIAVEVEKFMAAKKAKQEEQQGLASILPPRPVEPPPQHPAQEGGGGGGGGARRCCATSRPVASFGQGQRKERQEE